MALTVADAYNRIKALENDGTFALPRTAETVTVGTVDPKAGTFTWTVPTVEQTITIPPIPPVKTNTFIRKKVGVVHTDAVDLLLRFDVIPQPTVRGTLSPGLVARADLRAATTAPARPNAPAARASVAGAVTARAVKVTGLKPVEAVSGLFGETNGGVTIVGFPTVESAADHITVDAGLVGSRKMPVAGSTNPPVTTVGLAIDIPGHQRIFIELFVLRPPVLGMGVFTIPALPMTIVYAPPQGVQKKNSVRFASTQTVTRTVSSSISESTSTKTVQAYTAGELIGKVAGAIATVAAVVGTGGGGAAGGASVAGAMSQLGEALFGKAKEANDKTADLTKNAENSLKLMSAILTAVGEGPATTETDTLTVSNDHSMTITLSDMAQYDAAAGLGPGVGDRIVYLNDVKVAWVAVNGEVGIHIFGAAGIGANSVSDLMQEKARLQGGQAPLLGLEIPTIDSLLAVDPIVGSPKKLFGWIGAARIAPPRFVPAKPSGRNGSSTGAGGDVFQASYEVIDGKKRVVTNTQTRITDHKPGWGAVLFGEAENVQTTTTSTFTTTQVTEDKASDKTVSTITLHSAGLDDPYNVKIFYDNLFGTYCVVEADSPLLTSGIADLQVAGVFQ